MDENTLDEELAQAERHLLDLKAKVEALKAEIKAGSEPPPTWMPNPSQV